MGKPLSPTLRENKRYIVFEFDKGFSFNKVKTEIEKTLFGYLGVKGMSKVGLLFLPDFKNNKGIIRVNNKVVDDIRAGLLFLKKIDNKDVVLKVIYVSGILKKAREKL